MPIITNLCGIRKDTKEEDSLIGLCRICDVFGLKNAVKEEDIGLYM
jgi:hypothetical protein